MGALAVPLVFVVEGSRCTAPGRHRPYRQAAPCWRPSGWWPRGQGRAIGRVAAGRHNVERGKQQLILKALEGGATAAGPSMRRGGQDLEETSSEICGISSGNSWIFLAVLG